MIMIDFTVTKEFRHEQHLRVVRYYCGTNRDQVVSIRHKYANLTVRGPVLAFEDTMNPIRRLKLLS